MQGRKTKVKSSLFDARNGEEGKKGEKGAYAAAPITETVIACSSEYHAPRQVDKSAGGSVAEHI